MNFVTLYFLLVGFSVLAIAAAVILGFRTGTLRWSLLILALFVIGALWQEVALRTFAAREKDGMSRLIFHPVPYGGGDHEFSPNGAHYAKWGFLIPAAVTISSAFLSALAAVAISRTRVARPVTLTFIGGALGFILLALFRLFAASEIFI